MYKYHSCPFFLLLSTISLLAILATATTTALPPGAGPIVGGRTKIPNVEANKEVQSLGRYSVAQYNKNSTTTSHAAPLTFSRVVEAESQVVAGIKYYLKVVARVGKYSTTEKLFDAVVVVKPWLKHNKMSRELVSFTPSPY